MPREPLKNLASPLPIKSRAVDTLLPLILSVLALLLYVTNISSTVTYGGDTGELIAASHRLGIAHPTGYVFYTLLGRTFESILPWGEIAWRYNLLSALCGAGCVGVLARLMCEIFQTKDRVLDWPSLYAAGGASALLAGFYFFFGQSVLAEVYSLNALMLSLLLWCAWRWHVSVTNANRNDEQLNVHATASPAASPDWRWLWTLSFVFGLSLNAHMSCVFLLPALVLWCVWHHRKVFKGRALSRLAVLTFFTLCGFVLTLYLPLRSSLFPAPPNGEWWPLDWTHPTDFASWYSHIRAKQYEFLFLQQKQVEFFGNTTMMKWFVQPFSAIPPKLASLLMLLLVQWFWCLIFVPIGAFVAWKQHRALGGALLWIFAVNFAVQINYDVGVGELANFLFPAYIVMTLWMGFGLHTFFTGLQRWSMRRDDASKSSTRTSTGIGLWQWRVQTLSFLSLLATSLLQLTYATPLSSTRGNTRAREAALERARAVEQVTTQSNRHVQLWTNSDDALWSFWYAQFALNRAPRVETPWGQPWRRILRQQGVSSMASTAMRDGELAMAYYDATVDERFPLVPFDDTITPRGLAWRASRRKLPMPANIAPPLTKAGPLVNYTKQGFRVSFPQIVLKNSVAQLKREDLTRMTLDFHAPWTSAIANSPLEMSDSPPSIHIGFVQILIAPRDFFKTAPQGQPSPSQKTAFRPVPKGQEKSAESLYRRPPSPQASVQTLRLVAPQNVKPQQHLRATLPLQIAIDALGSFEVWVRLVRTPDDNRTAWQRTETIEVTPH